MQDACSAPNIRWVRELCTSVAGRVTRRARDKACGVFIGGINGVVGKDSNGDGRKVVDVLKHAGWIPETEFQLGSCKVTAKTRSFWILCLFRYFERQRNENERISHSTDSEP